MTLVGRGLNGVCRINLQLDSPLQLMLPEDNVLLPVFGEMGKEISFVILFHSEIGLSFSETITRNYAVVAIRGFASNDFHISV